MSETSNSAPIKRVEINYRGILQKNLAKRIGGDIIQIAHSEGKVGFTTGRYSDAPERDGVPCKYFAFVSHLTEEELEAECGAKYDIDEADVSIALDETMVKGVEAWAYYGIRPINEKMKPGGVQLIVSRRKPSELVKFMEKKSFKYKAAVLDGDACFAGLWVYNDDGTDVRVLGALAAVDSQVINIDYVEKYVKSKYGEAKAKMAREAYNSVIIEEVTQKDGIVWPYEIPHLPKWNEFEEGIVVPAVKRGFKLGPGGTSRSLTFKRGTTKSMRPIIRFDLCTKCTLCWLECPDECYDPTSDGLYDVSYEYCTGCGKCAEVCPVKECIVMVDENKFTDNNSPWEFYKRDRAGYIKWVEEAKGKERVVYPYVTGRGFKVDKAGESVPANARAEGLSKGARF